MAALCAPQAMREVVLTLYDNQTIIAQATTFVGYPRHRPADIVRLLIKAAQHPEAFGPVPLLPPRETAPS